MRWLLVILLSLPGAAGAAGDVAAAEALFRRGVELMEAWRLAEACPLIEESVRLDYGAAAEFRLAECLEKSGKLASAWARYTNVAHVSKQQAQIERAVVASRKASELAPRLPYLMVALSSTVAAIPELSIARDGIAMGSAQWGVPVPVDPGEHVVDVSAPGYLPLSLKISLVVSERRRVDVAALEREARPPAAPPPELVSPPTARVESAPGWQRSAGLIGGGVGAGGVALGVIVGVIAKSNYDDAVAAECDATGCSSRGITDVDDARALGDNATAISVVGGVVLSTGVALLLWSVLGD